VPSPQVHRKFLCSVLIRFHFLQLWRRRAIRCPRLPCRIPRHSRWYRRATDACKRLRIVL
jgi:hypothetical protein